MLFSEYLFHEFLYTLSRYERVVALDLSDI